MFQREGSEGSSVRWPLVPQAVSVGRHVTGCGKIERGKVVSDVLRQSVQKKGEKKRANMFTRWLEGQHLGHEGRGLLITKWRMAKEAAGPCPLRRHVGRHEELLEPFIGIDWVTVNVVHEVKELDNDICGHAGDGIIIFPLAACDVGRSELCFCFSKPSNGFLGPKLG